MAHFVTNELHTRRPIGGKRFELTRTLIFYSSVLDAKVAVEPGFETDFASIPWFLQSLIQVNGAHIHAAVVHDYLCVNRDKLDLTQKQVDQVFLEAMECCGVRWTQRHAMYRGVRMYQSTKGFVQALAA